MSVPIEQGQLTTVELMSKYAEYKTFRCNGTNEGTDLLLYLKSIRRMKRMEE